MPDSIKRTEFDEHEKNNVDCFNDLFKLQKENAEAIAELTKNTKDIITIYSDLNGAIRIGVKVQHFGIWLMKWPVIGLGLWTAYEWLIKHLPTS